MPKPSQEDELKKLADKPGPLKAWAIRQLIKLGILPHVNALDAGAPPAAPEPVPAPEEPKERPKVNKPGEHGNCWDCAKPFNTLKQRTPFQLPTGDWIRLCRKCADTRWKEIHGK